MKLSIIVPCYNEEKNIPLILEKFQKAIQRDDVEVILVNNGSIDKSAEILQKLLPRYQFAKTVFVPVNQGYGFGIIQGLESATGDFIGWTHADMQTDPADVFKALYLIEQKGSERNLYIKGNRQGRPLFDKLFTMGMSIFETLYLGKNLYEINAQPNVFSKEFYQSWKNPPHDFSLDLYALYMARVNNLNIIRFDVLFPKRLHGFSNWNKGFISKWKFIKRTVSFSIKLKNGGIK